jgi:hypothetical protein
MSASDAPALSAIAFQLAATLDSYDENVAALVRTPFDPELYLVVSKQMDQMRMYAASLPPVSVAWVEVMIRHFELTHGMWRHQQHSCTAEELKQLRAQLREAVERLSRKCVQMMPSA